MESIHGASVLAALVLSTASRRRTSRDDGTSPVGAFAQIQEGVTAIVNRIQRWMKRSIWNPEDEGTDERYSSFRREEGSTPCDR